MTEKPENEDTPQDDHGINTENILEIGEKAIRRAWEMISNDEEEISLETLERIVNLAHSAYDLSIKALQVGYDLTQEYLDDFGDEDEDFRDEEGYDNGDVF